ncbi:acyl-CoA synthetase [Hydrogenophaga sp.]|jgi:predicted LPLAT superfamily acyltransferase|uniref:LpxL/LpxP family acyltransferase n=1 Tax=Hydrogenophaga sp. TaxID=1904254 RepID=UPI0027226529|nr:acyl-CoA synthetase [Hydrogenophaga sp.]MDO9251435.1 acyl-CoA synthetase [Hydrogenophaga sp.]MDP2408577.1 acyl-CoA synthetase [Hydrogenophaga sp.]MDP3322762.1 acyl-CoA synthetase [Hydrogenophaga sp.]MDP3884146.1 acyl-CoA synthetase [Hydrogenophaga sp.]MDZ4175166.1 acyl-CoA synthetase [Hydrogenophaga sp.]
MNTGTGQTDTQPEWMRRQERSNLAILRLMVWISLAFGRRVGRLVLHGIAVYFVLFAPAARRASRAYLHRVLGRYAGWRDGYRHVFSFASTIHDRIYLLNDRFNVFDIEVRGDQALLAAIEKQPGALLMGAHLGSFEVLRAMGRGKKGLRVAMLMYEQNARKLNATLAAINPRAMQDIISLGHLESMLEVRDKLDEGYLVGMLADRSLNDDTTLSVEFLGEQAAFPLGPWRMAAMLKRPVFLMAGLYLGGNRYQLHFEQLADFSNIERGGRDAAIKAAVQAYADSLARLCRLAPYNWFNFFDFWKS